MRFYVGLILIFVHGLSLKRTIVLPPNHRILLDYYRLLHVSPTIVPVTEVDKIRALD